MGTKVKYGAAAGAILLIAILIGTTMVKNDYPVVRAAVGEDLGGIRARSTYNFDFVGMEDDIPYFIDEPVVFEYAGDDTNEALRFQLPLGRFVSLGQRGALVYDIKVSPQLEYLNLADVYTRSGEVAGSIATASGWRRTGRATPSLEELRDYYAAEAPGRRTRFGTWETVGGIELSVTIKRAKKADREYVEGYPDRLKSEEDLFLIDVQASSDFETFDKYLEMMRMKRAEREMSPNESLPIEAYLTDSTRQQ